MTPPDWATFDRALRAGRRAILERFVECLRVDTVSQQPARVRAGASWLARAMESRGFRTRVLETSGNPAVFGERRVPGAARTLLIYCHFDTKPAPPAGWLQPSPFEPALRAGLAEDGAPIVTAAEVSDDALPAHRLYARGASDDKGPIWAHLEALALMDALGLTPRVNLKLVLEGEEEIGSPGFGALVAAHRDLLAADLVLVTDGPKDSTERPTVVFGARGILALTLELEAARRDVHSGNFSVRIRPGS